ncbi:MAG: hypothetical protein FWC11_04940 [Firmicutes bacterium]|nr:hypothetical protein [Bacillota bacterium]
MKKLKKLTSRKKVRIYMLIVLVLVLPFFFTANFFNNTPQVNSRSFVTALGIDTSEDGQGVVLSAQVFLPMIEERTLQNIVLIESQGKTIMEALERLSLQNGQNVEFSQCRLIVVGDAKANDGITREVKSLFSNNNFCSNAMMLHVQSSTAHHFLSQTLQQNDVAGSVVDFIEYYEKNESIPVVTLMKFLSSTLGESNASFMPSIRLEETEKEQLEKNVKDTPSDEEEDANNEEGEDANNEEDEEGDEEIVPEERYVLHERIGNLETIAIFKNGELVGTLDEYQSSGMAFLSGYSKKGYLTLPAFSFEGEDFDNIFVTVMRKNSRVRVLFDDGVPKAYFTISVRILLNEKFRFRDVASDLHAQRELYAELEKAFEKEIEKKVQATLDASKELETDFLNLNYKFHRLQSRQIKDFKQSKTLLESLTTEFDITVRLD